MGHLFAIERTVDGLCAVWGDASPVVVPTCDEPAPSLDHLRVRRAPFSGDDRRDATLRNAWTALADAALDADALYAALLVALETIPSSSSTRPLPELPDQPPQPRATAAHPRAYRGTHEQPPKASAARQDLRPYVCDRLGLQRLRARLARHETTALERLRREGYDPVRLGQLGPVVDPYFAYHHGGEPTSELPPRLRTLLSAYRGIPWSGLSRLIKAHFALALDRDEPTWSTVLHLVHAEPEAALDWLGAIVLQPAAQRAAFITLLHSSKARARGPQADEPWLSLPALAPAERYRYWVTMALAGDAAGQVPAYMVAGLSIAHRYGPKTRFELEPGGDTTKFEVAPLERCLAHIDAVLARDRDGVAWEPTSIWNAERVLPGLIAFLGSDEVLQLEPVIARELAIRLAGLRHAEALEERWPFVHARLDEALALLLITPTSHRLKLVLFLADMMWFWSPALHIRTRWPEMLRIGARVCRPPFSEEPFEGGSLLGLVLSEPQAQRVLEMSDEVLLLVDDELRSPDRADLIEHGLRCVHESKLWPRLVERWLPRPRPLMRAMRVLAGLKTGHALNVLDRVAEHPLLAGDLLSRPLKEVCSLLASVDAGVVPRKLRDHCEGTSTLKPAQLTRALRVIEEGLPLVELQLLEKRVAEALKIGFGEVEVPTDALRIIRESEGNRRPYRNFLRAWSHGERDYLTEHPATRAWFKRHSKVDEARWRRGVVLDVDGDHGPLHLAVEQDPFEILRLGTYVGSCLQRGGLCAYSASAILLDANKRVVYARNQTGQVLARQVVAISGDDELVCYSVYPTSTKPSLLRHFLAYDERLAAELGLPLFRDPKRDYHVELILAKEWWDDHAWDFKIEA